MNDFVNLGICKHEFKFTRRGAAEAIADLPYPTQAGGELLKLVQLAKQAYKHVNKILFCTF